MKVSAQEIARLALALLEGLRLAHKEKDPEQRKILWVQHNRRAAELKKMAESVMGGTGADLWGYGMDEIVSAPAGDVSQDTSDQPGSSSTGGGT